MFKGRLGIWVILIVVCFVAQWLIGAVPTWFESHDLTTTINIKSDADFTQVLSNTKINKIKTIVKNEDPEMVITDNEEISLDNYTKYEDFLVSPVVMYACNVNSQNNGFIAVPNTSNCYKVDLKSILVAMEKDAEWDSLGIHKSVANGTVTLYIPNEQNAYYDDIVELFYLTINNGAVPDQTTREALKSRVDGLLKKCHKVADIGQAILEEYKDPSKAHKVFIGPEYLYQRGTNTSNPYIADSNKGFRPVYFLDTVYLTADVYIKSAENSEENYGKRFVENIQEKHNFMQQTGWRVKNNTFDLDKISGIYYESP